MDSLDNNNRWLYQRIKQEDPKAEPSFSFKGTVNWMRALAICVENSEFTSDELSSKYSKVKRRTSPTPSHDTSVFQFIFMSFQNLSALEVIREAGYPSDFVRSAIVAWYYGLYYSSSAMLAAADGSIQEDHRGTANAWDRQIVQNNLMPTPFDLRVSTMVKIDYEKEINSMRGNNLHTLDHQPVNYEQAYGACLSYLKGTAEYERKRLEAHIKSSKEFKELRVDNFKTKQAREIRDKRLDGKAVNFLHQAFRYRGKANYRDALYLGYGTEHTSSLESFIKDLRTVLQASLKSSAHYCARRVERGAWEQFTQDLEVNSRLKLSTDILKI